MKTAGTALVMASILCARTALAAAPRMTDAVAPAKFWSNRQPCSRWVSNGRYREMNRNASVSLRKWASQTQLAKDNPLRWFVVRENMRRFATGGKMYSVFDLARGYQARIARSRETC